MKIRSFSFLVAILIATLPSGITGCIDVTTKATAITGPGTRDTTTVVVTRVDSTLTLGETRASLVAGPLLATCPLQPHQIPYSTSPAGLRVTWTSTNTAITTIDANGVVTGHAPGTVPVTVALTDKPSVTAVDTIIVKACAPVVVSSGISVVLSPLTDVIPSGTNCSLYHFQLHFEVLPVGTSQAVTFSVTPAGTANVDAFGLVSAAAPGVAGSAIVTARSVFDPTASASITAVVANVGCTGSTNGVTIGVTPPVGSGLAGQTLQLTKTVLNSSATGIWTSSDSTKVKVSQTGLATFVAVGSTNVCYSIGPVVGCAVLTTSTPSNNVTVSINPPKGTTMHVGDTQLLSVTTNAADPAVNWSSSDPYWCQIDIQTGILKAIGTGVCKIFATLKNNPTGASAGVITVTNIP